MLEVALCGPDYNRLTTNVIEPWRGTGPGQRRTL
eukprot:CAMPEP_0195134238 /NCGR_PEP_ID=MMETSP0448-20130528/150248_1 /TAXON_ID=66468 /ORGANISM="Heterocapsa triquestra, Strain CCMP 448" /LENGTH=33 /DNA_ID= /DNA_START= /DNA_END= /DNA_ORIENTATION=